MNTFHRFIASLLIGVLVLPSGMLLAPQKAYAQIPVIDVANLFPNAATALSTSAIELKDVGIGVLSLDGIAWLVAKAAVASLAQSTINWINSGFQGSPGFVTNLRKTLLQVADVKANQFFNELASGIINSPYQDEIAAVVRTGYYLSTSGQFAVQNPFTLDQHSTDPLRFLEGDFDQGGFDAWRAVGLNSQNNPYGAYQLALGELNSRVSAATGKQATELNWYQGFKGLRGKCVGVTDAQKAQGIDAVALAEGDAVSLAEADPCQESSVLTPGSVIAPQINAAIGAGQNQLITADEIDEIIGALISQLVTKALGAGGLLGVSKPSSGGGRAFIDQAATQQQGLGSTNTTGASAGTGGVTSADTTALLTSLRTYEANLIKLSGAAQLASARCSTNTTAQSTYISTNTSLDSVRYAIQLIESGVTNQASFSSIVPTQAVIDQTAADASTSSSSLYMQLLTAPACTPSGSFPVEPTTTDPVTI